MLKSSHASQVWHRKLREARDVPYMKRFVRGSRLRKSSHASHIWHRTLRVAIICGEDGRGEPPGLGKNGTLRWKRTLASPTNMSTRIEWGSARQRRDLRTH